MRADRLVAILLMLQRRGLVTAADVAAELEVSERTARRDLEALGAAGMPVYSQQGRNGGWRLLGDGTTDLTGLSAAEVRALFLVAGPAASATKDVKAALRKLVRALPEPFREQAEVASEAIVVDPIGWSQPGAAKAVPLLLDELQNAVVLERQVDISYRARNGQASTRVVHPLGLVAKGAVWYLVADTTAGLRSFRVERITAMTITEQRVVRPPGFVLADAWELIAARVNDWRLPVCVSLRTDPSTARVLVFRFGARVQVGMSGAGSVRAGSDGAGLVGAGSDGAGSVGAGSVEAELYGQSEEILARELAGFGGSINVVSPGLVRERLAALGAELVAAHGVHRSQI